ncbi:MAG: YceI family protein [Bacteroidia bacterium]|nr:YceI family protein [Bacteroidia bacterium]
MKKITLIIASLFLMGGLMAQTKYSVDKAHASVNFKIKHMGITFVNGSFTSFDGFVEGDLNQMEKARVEFTVDTKSIDTRVERRDDHLRSADFFEVEKYPQMSFKSTGIEKVDDENYKLNGLLTIKDVTKPVTFDVKYGGKVTGKDGKDVIGFTAKNTINRLDYNVSYDPDAATVGKDVAIVLYMEFKAP